MTMFRPLPILRWCCLATLAAGFAAAEPPAGAQVATPPQPVPAAESKPPAPDSPSPDNDAALPDPVQVFGWREWATIGDSGERLSAKLDTGALTSSVHAEDVEPFERDGQKWVRFIITDPTRKDAKRVRITAPLVRTAKIKNPGGESESRLVVRLNFQIGSSKLRTEFTLNNRTNMISPVLVGRSALKELGLIDPGRTYLAEEKIMR